MIAHFTDLRIWQEAIDIAADIYTLVHQLPKSEQFALSDQLRRAASSISANIAEGFGRASVREKIQFLVVARGSLHEVQSHLYLAERLGYISPVVLTAWMTRTHQNLSGINASIAALRKKK